MNILQVNTFDVGGGAENIARYLYRAYQARGYNSWMAVGKKLLEDVHSFHIPNESYCDTWVKNWIKVTDLLYGVRHARGAGVVRILCEFIQETRWQKTLRLGRENFDFPATAALCDLPPQRPDIIHCHNLHGGALKARGYFDLRILPWLSREVPVVLTLHDAWLLSGHCAHSFGCERWKTGCGSCPDLSIYPEIQRDATAYNWQRKQKIYAKSQLYVVTPSHWLMQKVEQSMLAPAIDMKQVIPNGIDLFRFSPANQAAIRQKLGIPLDARVCLFVAHGIRQNRWKDYQTLRTAIIEMASLWQHNTPLLFMALGTTEKEERIECYGRTKIHFVPLKRAPGSVAHYYQAADLYVHAAKADNFPTTILEALACGLPVIATAVGGIPEQVTDGQTGFLCPPGDSRSMAGAIHHLLTHPVKRRQMSQHAVKTARQHFGVTQMVAEYLTLYQKLLQ